LPGAINASTTTGIRARSPISNDAGFGVEVANVSERYGGSQPASSSTIVANNTRPIRPITELLCPARLSRDQPSSPPPYGDAMVKAQPRFRSWTRLRGAIKPGGHNPREKRDQIVEHSWNRVGPAPWRRHGEQRATAMVRAHSTRPQLTPLQASKRNGESCH
jgi:hypothetical protein